MSAIPALELESGFDMGLVAVKRGAALHRVRTLLTQHWGHAAPGLRKREPNDSGPGAHGIPELGAHEQDFYDILLQGGRSTLDALRHLVDKLYEEGRGWGPIDPYSIDQTVDEWKVRAVVELASHPMEAYLLGQLFATEAIQAPMLRPLQPEDKKSIEFLEHYSFNEISSAFDELKGDLRHELIAGVEAGENPREVARRMANALKDYETQWGAIAVTETARAESQGRLQEFLDQGLEYVTGSSAHDSKVCDDCLRLLNNQTYRIKDIIGNSNYGRRKADWVACIPLHPWCRDVWLPADGPNG